MCTVKSGSFLLATEAYRDSSPKRPPSSRNHSVDSACRIAYFRDAANASAMPEGQEGVFCVDSYSQSYFRKVSLSTGVQFPEPFRQAVSVQEGRSSADMQSPPAYARNAASVYPSSFYYTATGGEKQYG